MGSQEVAITCGLLCKTVACSLLLASKKRMTDEEMDSEDVKTKEHSDSHADLVQF